MAATPLTTRLNVAASLLKLEATLRDIPVSRKTEEDRRAVRNIQSARSNLTSLTDPPV